MNRGNEEYNKLIWLLNDLKITHKIRLESYPDVEPRRIVEIIKLTGDELELDYGIGFYTWWDGPGKDPLMTRFRLSKMGIHMLQDGINRILNCEDCYEVEEEDDEIMTEKDSLCECAEFWKLIKEELTNHWDLYTDDYFTLAKSCIRKANNLPKWAHNCPMCAFVGDNELGELNCSICPGLDLWTNDPKRYQYACEQSYGSPYLKILNMFPFSKENDTLMNKNFILEQCDRIINFCEERLEK